MRFRLAAAVLAILLLAPTSSDARPHWGGDYGWSSFCGSRYCSWGYPAPRYEGWRGWGARYRKPRRASRPHVARKSFRATYARPMAKSTYRHIRKASAVPRGPVPLPRARQAPPAGAPAPLAIIGNLLDAFREHVASIVEPVRPGYVAIRSRSGRRAVVAREHAWRFAGLLRDLESAGYPIRSLGGYSYRRIDPRFTRGRRIMSRHASGAAIDVNQSRRNTVSDPMDRGIVSRVAAKWGLTSGGDWRSPDLGHFEVRKTAPPKRRTRLAGR